MSHWDRSAFFQWVYFCFSNSLNRFITRSEKGLVVQKKLSSVCNEAKSQKQAAENGFYMVQILCVNIVHILFDKYDHQWEFILKMYFK